jgi:hypothetical protein
MGRNISDVTIKIRVRGAQSLQRFLLGPIAGQIPLPAWYIWSIVGRLHDPTIKRHVAEMWIRTPATIESYDFPDDFPPYFRRTKAFDDRYAYRLRDVMVSPRSGVVWLPSGHVLEESYGSLVRSLGWGDIRPELLMTPKPCSKSVIPFPDTGYYHWLLEILPAALFGLRVSPNSWLLLSKNANRYVVQAAQMLAPGRIIRAQDVQRVGECIVSAIDPFSGFVQQGEIERLRSLLPRGRTGQWPTRVYVSRRKDRSRSLGNEEEVETAVRREGISVLYLQDLSFEDQIALFSLAELVVAPHGAGLANLAWAERVRRVVEIFPANYFNDCYARLSRIVGAGYDYVMSRPHPESDGIVPIEAVLAAVTSDE